MKGKPKNAKAIFLADKTSRIETIRAYAIGATDILHRPIDAKALLKALWSEFMALGAGLSDFPAGNAQGAAAAHDGLRNIFSSAVFGEAIDQESIGSACQAVMDEIESQGLSLWMDTVRMNHG